MYDQFSNHEAPVYETSAKPFKKEKPIRQENWQAVGMDGSQTPQDSFKRKCDDASTEAKPKTGASHEFWLKFTGQQTRNPIAMSINPQFSRGKMTDFDKEKARYIQAYAEQEAA